MRKSTTHTATIEHALGANQPTDYRSAMAEFRRISSEEGGGRNPYLITAEDGSAKLAHNADNQDVWAQGIVYLAPHRMSGVANLCPYSTPQCRETCLGITAGRMGMSNAQRAQKVRTRLLVERPGAFMAVLLAEAGKMADKYHQMGKRFALRLNGTSDIHWENVPTLLDSLKGNGVDVFIDYTKAPNRRGWIRPDYYVAESVSERTDPADVGPGHVVVVDVHRDSDLPSTWNGHPAIDGDRAHGDLRHLDPVDAVVLLRAKGAARQLAPSPTGFVRPVPVAIR